VNDQLVFDAKTWARLWGPYQNRTEASQAHIGTERGKRFYNLSFRSLSGKPMTLSDLQGKVVLLHLWGSWCPSCRREMPELQQLYQALGTSSNVQMVLLQVRENFPTARQWTRQQHLNLPFFDSGVKDGTVDSLTLAGGNAIPDRNIAAVFPTTYVLDRNGIVVFSHIGPVSRWSQYLPLLRDVAARSGK
jgi:thiol-disulfide isomerase/thioredoxin